MMFDPDELTMTVLPKDSSETGSKANDAKDEANKGQVSDPGVKYGDCGDPSGMLGPLLAVADEMMGAFDEFDKLVDKGLEFVKNIADKIKDSVEEAGPAAGPTL